MQKKAKGMMAAAILLSIWMSILPVHGAGNAVIPVNQTFTVINNPDGGTLNNTFTYTLKADVPTDPMPAGSIAGTYTFTISGNQTINIGPINSYTVPGTYRYKLKQTNDGMQYYGYDATEYEVIVTIINGALGLESKVAIKKNGIKVPMAGFMANYNKPSPPPPPTPRPPKNVVERIVQKVVIPLTQDSSMLAMWGSVFMISMGIIVIKAIMMFKEQKQ